MARKRPNKGYGQARRDYITVTERTPCSAIGCEAIIYHHARPKEGWDGKVWCTRHRAEANKKRNN